jgi:hypothetical protein
MLTFVKGLGGVVDEELAAKLGDFSVRERGPGYFLVDWAGDPDRLRDLSSIEDVFYVIYQGRVEKEIRTNIKDLSLALQQVSFDEALKYHARLFGKDKHNSFQLFLRMSGRWGFRRGDLERSLRQTIDVKFERWKPVRDNPKLEIDARLNKDGDFWLSLRLPVKNKIKEKVPTAERIKDSVAYALVVKTKPQPDDVWLDPACRNETILQARAQSGPVRRLIGLVPDEETKKLISAKVSGANLEINVSSEPIWPLPNESVTALATYPVAEKNQEPIAFYRNFLSQAARVLVPGGRLVILHSDIAAWENLLPAAAGLAVITSTDISFLGKPGRIWELRKSNKKN